MEIPEEAFSQILAELEKRPLSVNRYRKKVGEGRSQAFGIVGRRSMPPDYSRNCWTRPYLYGLLLDFGRKYCSIPFTSITINQNYKAGQHRDRNNVGNSFLVSFGSFTGGELEIHEGDKKGVWDICRKPIIEDFSKNLHSVKDFSGTRISLVFYTYHCPRYPTPSFPPPSVRQEGKKWFFYRGDQKCLHLPHPLRGRKKEKKGVALTITDTPTEVAFP